jgi:hypothetical protein
VFSDFASGCFARLIGYTGLTISNPNFPTSQIMHLRLLRKEPLQATPERDGDYCSFSHLLFPDRLLYVGSALQRRHPVGGLRGEAQMTWCDNFDLT